jgi:hypothetical protein
MIIAVRAVLITFFINSHIFSESLFAFLAHKRHFRRFRKWMGFNFSVAFSTIKPLLAALSTDGHLRIQDMFAVKKQLAVHEVRSGMPQLVKIMGDSN